MRKPIIAANWKMNKTLPEVNEFVRVFKDLYRSQNEIETVLGVPSIYLQLLVEAFKASDVQIAAEDAYCEDEGSFTGEISPKALKSLGVDYVILGHSERRNLFGETNDFVNQKVKAAYANKLLPIVCVGEPIEVREKDETKEFLRKQVKESLAGITKNQAEDLVIAYEPLWAIGTDKTAKPYQANEAALWIRETLVELFTEKVAQSVRIQYGGSVKPENIADLMKEENIDGALVGGASLEADSFNQLLEYKL